MSAKNVTVTTHGIPLKAFEDISEICNEHNWRMVQRQNELIYKHCDKELIFRFYPTEIHVSIPLKTSDMNYVTKFTSYFDAVEYGIQSLKFYFEPIEESDN